MIAWWRSMNKIWRCKKFVLLFFHEQLKGQEDESGGAESDADHKDHNVFEARNFDDRPLIDFVVFD
jgi:hypothetical protein